MDAILIEMDRVGHLGGLRPNFNGNAQRVQLRHELRVKIGHGARCQRNCFRRAGAGFDQYLVFYKIKQDFKSFRAVGDGRSGEASRGQVERHFPPMVHLGAERQPNLAHDLGAHVQGIARGLPLGQG